MRSIFYRICISLSRLVPHKYNAKFKKLILYSGKNHDTDFILGIMIFSVLMISLLTFIFINLYPYEVNYVPFEELKGMDKSFGVVVDGQLVSGIVDGLTLKTQKLLTVSFSLVLLLIVLFGIYGYYYYLGYHRSIFVEKILPDVLSLISSNINSGLTPYHAVKSAIRDEFGPLADAFQVATNKSLGNKAFEDSICEVADNFKSDSLSRSMKLFSAAISSGSNIAGLLKSLAKDIRERKSLKNELVTSTKTSSMFILFMIVVGAPLLMAISIFFVDIVTGILDNNEVSDNAAMGIAMGGEVAVTSTFLNIYSYIFLFFAGVLVSYFSGVVVEGDGRSGLKIAPIIVGLSYAVFFVGLFLVRYFLGGLF